MILRSKTSEQYNLGAKPGFTLIELLVVMAMTAIIATITLANYRVGEIRKRVSLASDSVVNTLSLAQSYALSGKATTNTIVTCRTPQYYYVSFLMYANNYTLYALDNCATIDTIQTFSLPANTRITGLSVDATSATTSLNIAIYPPFGQMKTLLNGGAGPYNPFSSATITVESNDNSVTQNLSVNGVSGRIGQ